MDIDTDLPSLVEDLEVNIDELELALNPLLSTPLRTTSASLTLLDRSKLHVLSAYAIESLLFSALQASGSNAKEHAIFPELARLKGYFAKIKQVENSANAAPPSMKLDKGAAARFIRHGLAGNERYDAERAEKMAKEKARAALRARQLEAKAKANVKFDQEAETEKLADLERKRKAEAQPVQDIDDSDDSAGSEDREVPRDAVASHETQKTGGGVPVYQIPGLTLNQTPTASTVDKKTHRGKRGGRKEKIKDSSDMPQTHSEAFNTLLSGEMAVRQKERKEKRERKMERKAKKSKKQKDGS